jgi:hypothetical protein
LSTNESEKPAAKDKKVEKGAEASEDNTEESGSEPVAKGEVESKQLSALEELEGAIVKAKALTPDRVEALTKAVTSIQGVLETLATQKSKELAEEAKPAEAEKVEKSEKADSVMAKLDELVTALTKRLDGIDKRVEEIETAKAAPKSIGSDATDTEEKKVKKSLWNGVLFS